MRRIIFERQWIGDADSGEGQTLLLAQIRNLARETTPKCMPAATQKNSLEQRGDILGRYGAIGKASRRGLHFNHRLQPIQPARTIANESNVRIAACRF